MPRRDGDVFLFGTAMTALSFALICLPGWRAYRRMRRTMLGGAAADAGVVRGIGGRAALIEAGEPADQDARRPGAAANRIRQDGGEFRRLLRCEIAGRLAEGEARCGFGAELAVGTPFGDVEVDFEHPTFRQHQIDPQRERDLERL